MDSLFEAFTQTTTGKQTHDGTGLGLAISRKLIQLMGGEFHVHSQLGSGTIFSFDIRAGVVGTLDLDTRRFTHRVIALEPGQQQCRILIVDDNLDNRKLFLKLFDSFDLELREAENGLEAFEIWKQWNPHMILMDLYMPVMDGYETVKQIRKAADGRQGDHAEFRTVIIAVTANTFEEEHAEALSRGCDDFLRKPFRKEDVFALLSKHLGLRFVYSEQL